MSDFSFNHIALAVRDVEESIAFYQKLFHLEEIQNTASKSKTKWLALGGGKELHLIPRIEFTPNIIKANHFAMSTQDIDAFVERLKDNNIAYSDWHDHANKIHVRDDGLKQVYFQDPNGYWIEVNNAG